MPETNGETRRFLQGAGTTVVRTVGARVKNVFIPSNLAGTLTMYDSSTAAGTSASNAYPNISNVVSTPALFEFNWQSKNGLVIVTSGTVDQTITIE